ncbi:2-oxo acid dehydrogenase subunit E2 [Streptomyces sp. NPDC047315]|uniref:2-oxo acid dehydrogenase subunit E2 n=1 Tax=Streptomyces sp. NPDC047315 TaxID=3155142 RepID=UPI0033EC0CC1
MAEFTMPSLGADMDEGTLVEWLVGPGDQVHKGDPVAVVETAKSTIEVECFETGTVAETLVEPGATVPVGTPLAVIGPPGKKDGSPEGAGDPKKRSPGRARRKGAVSSSPPPKPVSTSAPAPVFSAAESPGHAEAGPLTRHLAEQSGLDLERLPGSGPGGRITRTDVEAAVAARATTRPRRVRATPLARRLAAELDVDLTAVAGTGKDAVVRAADVRRSTAGAADATTERSGAERPSVARMPEEQTTAMRRAIADLMSRANRDIPHYYLSTTVDMAAAMDRLHELNRRSPVAERLLPAALLLKAVALAARQVPELNGFWNDDRFTPGDGVHLAVAVSLRGGGLVAPALRHADTLPLPGLMAALKDLVTRARTGRLRGSEVSGATITVSNLGDQGVETILGVIYPPQVALVGFGRLVDRPWAVGGLLGVRPVVTVSLSADHRATNGVVGARFLTAVDRLLQKPEQL